MLTEARLPTFLIVGAMRSGTTSLARYMGAHPEVYVAPEKEVHFFDRHFERGLNWYASRLPDAFDAVAVGEATQSYLYDPLSVERIARTLPDVRLVAILRDPVERAYSHYRMNRSLGIEALSFPDALEAEPARLAEEDRATRFAFSYVDRGLYGEQLLRLDQYFEREQVHVAWFDELRSDPAKSFAGVCRFLCVDDSCRPHVLGRRINATVAYRSLRVRHLARKLPGPLRKFVGKVNTREVESKPLETDIQAHLRARFRNDAQLIAQWVGRPVPWVDAKGSVDVRTGGA